jgi:hypothetical protein
MDLREFSHVPVIDVAPLARRESSSSQNVLHDSAVHIGQAEVAAGVAVSQLLVVESQEMQQCRMQIVHVDLAFTPPPASHVVNPPGL